MNHAGAGKNWQTSIAVFAARETLESLLETIQYSLAAALPNSVVDILVNGNESLAKALVGTLKRSEAIRCERTSVRVWNIKQGDKAHAWNQYIHYIWPESAAAFFVDGYVRLKSDAVQLLSDRMAISPDALGGTGVPSVGRSAAGLRDEILQQGGIHGNFCSVTKVAMTLLKTRGFALPLGLYRTDATFGAVLSFGLDPAVNQWSPKKFIVAAPDATWMTDEKLWWRLADWKGFYKRKLRQAQGEFENAAIRDHFAVRKQGFTTLPSTVNELVLEWIGRCPGEARTIMMRNPLSGIALRRLRRPTDWSLASLAPQLLASFGDK